jgi:hypothetical protein
VSLYFGVEDVARDPSLLARAYAGPECGVYVNGTSPAQDQKLGRFEQIGHRITGDRKGQSNSRGVGWEYLHLAIDDHSRVAYSEILPDEKRRSCLRFLFNALRFFRAHGVKVQRVMTDNGASFRSRRYAKALRLLKIKHLRTKPYTPKTNGKAERFVQTSLREWAYAQAYLTSDHCAQHLPGWLHRYNWHRPHTSLKSKPPISRLGLTEDNLLRLHTAFLAARCSIHEMILPDYSSLTRNGNLCSRTLRPNGHLDLSSSGCTPNIGHGLPLLGQSDHVHRRRVSPLPARPTLQRSLGTNRRPSACFQ